MERILELLRPRKPVVVPMTILCTCLIVWSIFSMIFINERNVSLGILSRDRQKVPVRIIKQNEKLFKYKALAPYDFQFSINNESLCSGLGEDELMMVIFVYTCPQDSTLRQHIRNTWGNKAVLENYLKTIVLFPLGLSHHESVNQNIRSEGKLHGDILQGNFADTYHNLSYKAVMTMQWAARFCNRINFLLKVDVDIFVNVFVLVRLLHDNYRFEKRFVGCKVHWRSRVLYRGQWCGKWCVSHDEYPGSEYYPVYCWGPFYIVSGDLIQSLSEATKTVPIWWISDVYITGLIPRYLQLRQNKIQHLVLTDYIEEEHYFLQKLQKYPLTTVFGVITSSNDLYRAWNIVKTTEHLP